MAAATAPYADAALCRSLQNRAEQVVLGDGERPKQTILGRAVEAGTCGFALNVRHVVSELWAADCGPSPASSLGERRPEATHLAGRMALEGGPREREHAEQFTTRSRCADRRRVRAHLSNVRECCRDSIETVDACRRLKLPELLKLLGHWLKLPNRI